MSNNFIHSLKFQITTILVLLLSLFSFAISYTLYAIDERGKEMAALHLIHRLQLITSSMDMQSMNYLKNAPKSSTAYKRDIDLYYNDLKTQLLNKNEIIKCFADEHLTSDLTDMDNDIHLNLGKTSKQTISRLQMNWDHYFKELNETLDGQDNLPKLAAAAQYILKNQSNIKKLEDVVVQQLQQELTQRIEWINFVNKMILALAFIISLSTLLGFYIKVIIPLNKAVAGFDKVAKGDFGHQVSVSTNNEITSIVNSFNHLSQRLHSIFQLIERVQQGDDLDETLGFIAEQFSSILPINWTSVLLHNGNATMLELQKAYMDGKPQTLPRTLFSVESTLLEKAMLSDKPLLISNLTELAKQNKNYEFLGLLAQQGMNSAIFLHLTQETQVPGMLIFASREVNAYNEEHIELLNNIAHLVTHSFGKTIKMAEQRRLAAIGEFTSGIVHEVRNPLTTIGLSLKYFSGLQLDEDGQEWAEISSREAARMKRLLEDILLYSKPVQLDLTTINLITFLDEFLLSNKALCAAQSLQYKLNKKNINETLLIKADSDRLKQILLNIYQNAVEAANKNSTIELTVQCNTQAHTVDIVINNQGEVIDKARIERIGEPFFTTKTRGTGLGMGIVKRMIEAHSGHLHINSSREKGTDVIITLAYIEG